VALISVGAVHATSSRAFMSPISMTPKWFTRGWLLARLNPVTAGGYSRDHVAIQDHIARPSRGGVCGNQKD
jgi:hypothetical protein